MILSQESRLKRIITTLGKSFELSRRNEVEGLIDREFFKFQPYDPQSMRDIRLFRSSFVDEVKGKTTSTIRKVQIGYPGVQ